MGEIKVRSVRMSDDDWQVFSARKGTQAEVMHELLAGQASNPHAEVNRWFRETWARLDEILETVQSEPAPLIAYRVPSAVDEYPKLGNARVGPATIPGGSVGAVIKRYRCDHCGKSPAVARVGDICGDCRDAGHNDEPRSCRECANNHGTGAL